jgi:hypothetical protein
MSSNAVSERGKQTRLRKVARQKPQAIFLVVHRVDDSVYFKRIEPEAFKFLKALREGKSLSVAVVQAFEGRDIQEKKLLATVRGWFENWSSLGWFCAPNSIGQDSSSASGRQS